MTISVTHSTPADSSFSSTGATAWNANHTLTGVGTIAEQNANAVAITGGNIDGTVIGNTTPAAGTFTTLGVTTSINASGAGANVDLNVNAKGTGNVVITPQSTNAVGLVIAAPSGSTSNSGRLFFDSTSGVSAIANIGGNQLSFRTAATIGSATGSEQARVAHTASAVNYVQVTGAATGGRVTISAQGSDANVPVIIGTKGAGSLNVRTDGSATTQFAVTNTSSAVNYINVTGATTTNAPVISALGSDTNIPLVLQPKGTGALQAQQTDSTATGGNARGANAVDWQTIRSGASQVAAGQYGVVSGGISNTVNSVGGVVGGGSGNFVSSSGYVGGIFSGASNQANGFYSPVVGGASNQANGYYNFIGGGFTNTGTASAVVTTQSGTMNGTTAVTLSGSNANIKVGQYISGTSIAGDTYVAAISGTSLTLSKVASGSSTSTLSFFTPHGVVVGGGNNQATGSYSFIGGGGDAGTAANRNVASGAWSFVGGGGQNNASGNGSFVGGGGFYNSGFGGNTASGLGSSVVGGFGHQATAEGSFVGGGDSNLASGYNSAILGGRHGTTRGISGNQVFAACYDPVANAFGASQAGLLILGRQTTDATATVLTSNASVASGNNQVILPNNSAYYFKGTVVAGKTAGGDTKGWTVEGVIKRGANAASTALVGTPTVLSSYGDAGATTWALTATADTTNGGLAITFTGQAATTIRTVARLETVEMTF